MKKIFFFLFLTNVTFAQNAARKYLSHHFKDHILEIKTSDGDYLIKNYTDRCFETSFVPNGQTFNPESHAVVAPINTQYYLDFKEKGETLELSTAMMKVRIQKSPLQITYLYADKELISEKYGYTKKDSTETLSFNLDSKEALYGGGARVLGMNRRGNRLQLYNRAHYGYGERSELMNFTIPLVLSSKMYAVHFDNPAIGYLDLDSKKDNTLTYETISGRKTYQVIAGDDWGQVMQFYTMLTGTQPLPPRWAFGNLASRFGYHNQGEVEKTIRKFEEDKIPVDGIILDLYWFGKTIQNTMGNLEWDKDNFPNPDKMIADLNAKHIKTILITEPFILTTSKKWQEAADKKVLATDATGNPFKFDFYFGNTGIVDIFKPEGKTWFWNIYKKLVDQGIGGWWGDLGEPEMFPSKGFTAKGKADEVHNIYGHNWAKLIADGYKTDFPNVRPFILMRAGYSGSQHYGMIPWSGDVSRSWAGLQAQPEIALQMNMQGIGYMHSDLGGFAGDYFDNELYLRWLQYGVFQPIFRPHAHEDVAPEPVYKDIVTKAKAKKLVELRYELMPYNYSMGFMNSLGGVPLMRPLFFEEPENSALYNLSETYFWGKDFLVHPITKAGLKSASIYFPKTNNWFDFYTDKKYVAGTTVNVTVAEDHIPVFVRGGSFIPMIKPILNTSQYSLSNFDLHFYFDPTVKESGGGVYDDDGVSPNAMNEGKYEILTFANKTNGKALTIQFENKNRGANYPQTDKTVSLIIHNLGNVKKVTIDGKSAKFQSAKNKTTIIVDWKKATAKSIKIQY